MSGIRGNKRTGKGRGIKGSEMQYIYVQIPQDDCNYYALEIYTNKNIKMNKSNHISYYLKKSENNLLDNHIKTHFLYNIIFKFSRI